MDYKTGDPSVANPWYYIPKTSYHLKRRELNKKQLIKHLSSKEMKQFVADISTNKSADVSASSFSRKLLYDRLRNYYVIGNDWLVKFQNGDFLEALQKLVIKRILDKKTAEKITNGLYKFNQVVGLAQNGHAIVLADYKSITRITDYVHLRIKNEKISISHKLFLPKIERKGNKTYLSLIGYHNPSNKIHKKINRLIRKKEIKTDVDENQFLIQYSKMKREFLLKLIKSNMINDFRFLNHSRCYYGLDALVSKNFTSKRERKLIQQPENNRGVSYFYDFIQPISITFLKYRDLMNIIGRDKNETMFDTLVSLLYDPEAFFNWQEGMSLSQQLHKSEPFEFFLLNSEEDKHMVPPTFSYRKNVCPRVGVILVDKQGEILHYGTYMKRTSIQLNKEDIFLNFPFRWDENYGYFSFTQKGNKFSLIGDAWNKWLENEGYSVPTGESGKIPSESVIALLLEWWKRQTIFIKERILTDSDFNKTCNKNELIINHHTGIITDKQNEMYSIAKVSIRGDNSIQHKNDWKLFGFYNNKLVRLLKILEAVICDITAKELGIDLVSVSNLKELLADNWLDDLKRIKNYFIDFEEQ